MDLTKAASRALQLTKEKQTEYQWYNLRPILGNAN